MTESQVTTLARKALAAGIDHDVERGGKFNGTRMVWGDCRIRMRFPGFCCTVIHSNYKNAEKAIRDKKPEGEPHAH